MVRTRYTLTGLLIFGGLNAIAGGYYGLSGADNVPLEWLEGSPFTTYFLPSLILFAFVGGSQLAAGIAMIEQSRFAHVAAFGAGTILLGWIGVQLSIIGYVSWMQPVTAAGGVVIVILAWLLHM